MGYLTEVVRKDRFTRNHPLLHRDMEKYPHRILQKYLIMRDNNLLNMYEHQTTGQVSDAMLDRAQEVCDLYREYFLGKATYVNANAIGYYNSAMQLLGQGIDVQFDIRVNKDGFGDQLNGHGTHFKFSDMEEAQREINWRIEEKFKPLIQPRE